MSDSLNRWIENLFLDPDMAAMGHDQTVADSNLGLGWIYYGLARILRPADAVVIGSYRGFVPMVLARALADNGGGCVHFIDPSLVDDFWKDRRCVDEHFARHGVPNVQHYQMTTQAFLTTEAYRALNAVAIVFIDGYHTAEQARFDHEAFRGKLRRDGIVLFHDSIRVRPSRIYGEDRIYTHTVRHYVDDLKRDASLQVFDLPFGDGVTLVRTP